MNRDEFWTLIEGAGSGDAPEMHAEQVLSELVERPEQDMIAFHEHLNSVLAEGYSWPLWGAAYLINGGCSDDGFEYFRGWLLLQGRAAYEGATVDPDSLADAPNVDEDVECESILYVAKQAYEQALGGELPESPYYLPDLGAGWDFDDDEEMERRYPKLFARFCGDEDE